MTSARKRQFRYPSVSILVLNWNNAADTLECLHSLTALTYPNFDVVVIDNGSDDNSVEKFERFKRKNEDYKISILRNKKNKGFAGGNNTGFKYALKKKRDYVLVLNNDTIVEADFLSQLVRESQQQPEVGIIVPAILFYDQPKLLWFGGTTSVVWPKMNKGINCTLLNKRLSKRTKANDLSFATGCAMLVRRDALKATGGFDEQFFLYFEDADFSFRMQKAGWRLRWEPRAKIWHKVSSTAQKKLGSPGIHYYDTRNILLLSKKHGPAWMAAYRPLWASYTLAKQMVKLAAGRNPEVSRAIAQGIVDYYRGRFGKYTH